MVGKAAWRARGAVARSGRSPAPCPCRQAPSPLNSSSCGLAALGKQRQKPVGLQQGGARLGAPGQSHRAVAWPGADHSVCYCGGRNQTAAGDKTVAARGVLPGARQWADGPVAAAPHPLLHVASPLTGLNSGLGMEMAGAWCQRATAPAAGRGSRGAGVRVGYHGGGHMVVETTVQGVGATWQPAGTTQRTP